MADNYLRSVRKPEPTRPKNVLADAFEEELLRRLGRRSATPYRQEASATPIMDAQVAAGLNRMRNAGRLSGLPETDPYYDVAGVQDVLSGAGQVASAPLTGLLQPVAGPFMSAVTSLADAIPSPDSLLTYKGQSGERPQSMSDAARSSFANIGAGVDAVSDAVGYPREYGREAAMAGAGLIAGPVVGKVGRGVEVAEGLLNRAGYTARPQAGTLFSGGGPVKLADDGIIAYHGSPHSFDKFSMDKIGTGEGAQAYGHGLYFAEAEGVGNSYRGSPELKYARLNGHMSAAEEIAYDMAMQNNQNWRHDAWKVMRNRGIADDQIFDAIDKIEPGRGSMYQVHLNVKPHELLDWDKPMTGQPDIVQKALAARHLTRSGIIDDRPLGEVLDMPARYKDGSDIMLTDDLKKAGVKGIRYKDAGSRGGRGGTYNYVIFDDNLITILKKYGIPMTAGAGGAMMVAGEAMPPELAAQMGGGA